MAPCCLWPRLFLLIQEARRLGETPQSDCLPLPRYMLCIIFKNKIKPWAYLCSKRNLLCARVCVCFVLLTLAVSCLFIGSPVVTLRTTHTYTQRRGLHLVLTTKNTLFFFSFKNVISSLRTNSFISYSEQEGNGSVPCWFPLSGPALDLRDMVFI